MIVLLCRYTVQCLARRGNNLIVIVMILKVIAILLIVIMMILIVIVKLSIVRVMKFDSDYIDRNPSLRFRGDLLTACNATMLAKSKMANGVWKGVYPPYFWLLSSTFTIRFFSQLPSIRKVDNREKQEKLWGWGGNNVRNSGQ